MTTAELIISRLPKTPVLSPADIAAAAGLKSSVGIINACVEGRLDSVKIAGRYIIARTQAEEFIKKAEMEVAK